MIRLIFLFFILLMLNFSSSYSQEFNFTKEIKFSKYLSDVEMYEESLTVLRSIDTIFLTQSQKDSFFYEIGWLNYSLKKLDSAIYYFNKISKNDTRKLKTTFFASYSYSFLKEYDSSISLLKNIDTDDSVFTGLKKFELAGLALLKKDYLSFDLYKNTFSFTNYAFGKQEKNLIDYEKKIRSRKKKSPFIAATLSAIIPGSGKWYAGKKKEGFGALLPIISTGLLALEGYNKGGLSDARFIIFGSLFTTFYIGNIWGSAFAVKISQTEFEHKYENKILFDLHIPLRNLFN